MFGRYPLYFALLVLEYIPFLFEGAGTFEQGFTLCRNVPKLSQGRLPALKQVWPLEIGVQQLGLKGRLQELVLSVLARMDDERRAQVACRVLRTERVIDEETAATCGSDELTSHDAFTVGKHEQCLDLRLVASGTHHIRPEAVAGEEVECLQDEALACPGLTCEHVQSVGELEFHVLDEGEVSDAKIFQHGRSMCGE